MTTLPIMGDVAKTPLYITSHTHSKAKEIKAMKAGADAYKAFGETAKEDVDCCLLHLQLPEKWARRVAAVPPVVGGGDIILSKTRRLVYGKNEEIKLTQKEFDILMLLMDCQGTVLSSDQIIETVWKKGADNPSANALRIHMNHLRSKLAAASPDYKHVIVNIQKFGYCFLGKD
jgi:DNA-binding response OmpR family regulator